jgi:cyclase
MDIKRNIFGKPELFSHSGQKKQSGDPLQHVRRLQDLGAGEVLINSIDRDGAGQGYDLDFLKAICCNLSIPVIACGGAGSLSHFKEAIDAGASAVAAGSFFVFHGKHRAVLITYPNRSDLQKVFDSENPIQIRNAL